MGIVYNGVTGFFSDALSYVRIMALMLSGSVIASVFNTLGATTGIVPVFIVISLLGNLLNFALCVLGAYVHDLRLQCLEFFGRFYEEGGKPYQPLSVNTSISFWLSSWMRAVIFSIPFICLVYRLSLLVWYKPMLTPRS